MNYKHKTLQKERLGSLDRHSVVFGMKGLFEPLPFIQTLKQMLTSYDTLCHVMANCAPLRGTATGGEVLLSFYNVQEVSASASGNAQYRLYFLNRRASSDTPCP